jgi:steroid delta-isomerase-like uncharacterized protein
MDAVDVAALIDRYNAAWNAHDVDAITSMHAEDVVFANHTAGETAEGRDTVAKHIAGIFERWPDIVFRARRLYTGDGHAVCEWTATGTAPDGRRLEWDGVDVFPIEGGRIARKDIYSSSHAPRVLESA